MHVALLKFTVLRLGLFVASLGLLFVLGMRGLITFVLAAVISLVLSYILLRRQREELAQALEQRTHERLANRQAAGADADAAAEDGTGPQG
ncbi:DUF4229 domain-containing protein [Spongisporangium articulatum]|uniref:DUF4229 domain-containing protein n=1 Tax=Spongisporangium articulatum TaxID=3362603 RepID=A0ABW8AQR9_9ACTN